MKKLMSIAAIALMMAGSTAFAGGCGSKKCDKADKDMKEYDTKSEMLQAACGGSKKGDDGNKTACGGGAHKHDGGKKAA